ncbi:MAG: energy-coupling factor transporter transmembrane component T [Streptococcus vestibularis]|uniref:energy-coupling factor transporter transmembrane component T n=1 Tax=Streptococcus vestibularis TaxID=1343 RepID=UPI00290D722E|nr:energy-coupling factor transporter transmembrane component T [Streptococcus vestibularis]MDU5564843.1 energy-coupling factor transporter transmembrane component T [Streptococcus vestibularis]
MILPSWMLEERPVVTKVGRNNFLIRNRHHLEALLQKFETHPLKVASVFHPTAKVLLLFFLLISVGISQNLTVLWILALFLGAGVAFLPHSVLVRTLKKTVVLLIFPLVLYLPHLLLSGGQSLFLFRLPLIAVAIAYYSETSTISEMLAALKGLHFPNLVLLQLDITIKYIDVFGKQLMDLLKGIEARSFGGNHRFRIGSNIWGMLYLKAIRYGEELTQAMEARCFVGEYVKSSQSFTWKDWLALISLVAVILGQILLGG